MKVLKIFLCLLTAACFPRLASALIVGPYTPDANTLHLWHLDESAVPCLDAVSAAAGGTNFTYSVGGVSFGGAAYYTNYSGTINNFTNAPSFGTVTTSNAVLMAQGSGFVGTPIPFKYAGTSGAFTYEAVVHIGFNPTNNYTATTGASPAHNNPFQIMNFDADGTGTRVMQLRLDPVGFAAAGRNTNFVGLEFIDGTTAFAAAPIPTNGPDAIVSNNWYHVAVTYNGSANTTSNLLFYWTLMDPTRSSADLIYGTNMVTSLPGTYTASTIVTIGNGARNPSGGTGPVSANFLGQIDEVRISSVARAANQMMFQPATVAITQQPIGQEGVDYGGTGILSVSAASALPMGYQWRQNTTPIAGATNTLYTFTNATLANAGSYTCVITNNNGSSITSSVASVVIGAANFLTNRYSFTSDASDSIGGQNGTNVGGVTYNGNGTLTLDGSSGYIQLPSNIINTNQGAVTIETWASFGTIANNSQLFAFGNTNGTSGYNYIFSTPHGTVARMAITSGNYTTEQIAAAGSPLDNYNNVQIVCVFAPYANTETFYTNGVLAAVNTNATLPLSSVINNFSYIGKSLYSGDPYLAATIDEFRIYNGALSASSVQQSYLEGSTNILSDGPVQFLISPVSATTAQGQPVTFSSVSSGHQPIVYQWYKNGVAINGATNSSYTYSPTYSDNNASFQVLATNVVNATAYSAASGSATLTVLVPATLAWFGASDQYWNFSSLNWSNAAQQLVAYAQYDGAVFDDRGLSQPTVDLQSAFTPVSVTVSNSAENYSFISSAQNGSFAVLGTLVKQGPGTLQIDVTNNSTSLTLIQNGILQVGNGDANGSLGTGPVTNNAVLSFNRADTALNVANPIHGTGTVSFDGGGTVTISGTNDYTGSTLINTGIANLQNASGLGNSSGTAVASGGQLYITANVNIGSEPLALNGVGDGNGALRKGGAGITIYNGPVALTSDSTIGIDGSATLSLSNTISGASALTAIGSGNLVLGATNSFANGLTLNGPIVNLNANNSLGYGPVTVAGNGRFILANGLYVTNSIIANSVSPGAATGLLMVNDNTNGIVTTISGPIAFNLDAANGGHFVGPTSSGYLNISGAVTMPAATFMVIRLGNIRFSGSGSSYPEIQVRANTTSLGANNAVATNAVMDLAGNGSPTVPTFFDLNGFNQQLAGLKNTVTPANLGVVTNSSAIPSTLTLDLGIGNSFSTSASLAGNLSLAVNSGQETFTAATAYTGSTTVNGGTLELAQPTLAPNAAVVVASGAVLQLDFTVTNTVSALVLNGVAQAPGVYSSTTSSPYLAGSGSLQVAVPVASNPTNIIASVSGRNLSLSWPADHTGWRLLMQTNNLAQGVSNNTNDWSTVSGSATTNQVNITIDPTKPTEFYRMVYP